MNTKKIGWLLFGMCLAGQTLSTPLPAVDVKELDQLEERRRALGVREAEANRSLREIEMVQRCVGLLQDYRDQKLFGPSGIIARVDAWNADFAIWVAGWDEVSGLLSVTDRANIFLNVSRIQDKIRTQSEKLSALTQKADELGRFSVHHKLTIDPVDEATLKHNPEFLRRLNTTLAETQTLADKIKADFSRMALQHIGEAVKSVADASRAKMRIIALQYPELEQGLVEARATLDFIEAFAAPAYRLTQDSELIVQAVNQSRVFAARSALAKLEEQGASLLAQMIARSGVAVAIKQPMLDSLQRNVTATREHYTRVTGVASLPALTARCAKQQRLTISRDCRDAVLAPQRNCELLRTLNALDLSASAIRHWTEADLTYLEERLERVAKPAAWQKGE